MKNDEIINTIQQRIDMVINQPDFDPKAAPSFKYGNNTGILLIHGFDDSAFIMKELNDFLTEHGYTVYNITLPGRGMKIEQLSKTIWEEWVSHAMKDYMLLNQLTQKNFIIGFSTGAAIAMYMTQHLFSKDKLDGIILMSPAVYLASKFIPLWLTCLIMEILQIFKPFPDKINNRHLIIRDSKSRDIYEDSSRKSCAHAIIELIKLIKAAKKKIKKIDIPVLIVQSTKDVVVDPSGALWLKKNLKTEHKDILWLEQSGHPVMVDLEKEKVFTETLEFIKKFSQ